MLYRLTVGLILVCLASSAAQACRGEFDERTIIFVEAPTSLDAPVVVEATIVDRSEDIDAATGLGWAVMNGRIDRVIRGSVDIGPLKIVTEFWDCTTGFGAGSHGIVVGTLRRDAQGPPELVAIQESNSARRMRKAREQAK